MVGGLSQLGWVVKDHDLELGTVNTTTSVICFSKISRVAVLLRPHSANGPLLGTIAGVFVHACAGY